MSTYLLPLLTVHVPCSHHEDFFLQLDWESVPVTFVGAFTTFMETVDFSLLGRCCHSSQQKWRPSIYQDDVNWGYKMGQSSHSNWKAKVSNRLSCRKDSSFRKRHTVPPETIYPLARGETSSLPRGCAANSPRYRGKLNLVLDERDRTPR